MSNAKLDTINTALADIKSALIEKGAAISGNITTYADLIENLETGSDALIIVDYTLD